MTDRDLTDAEYRRLLEFRTGLRQFLHWSEREAAAVGVSPAQHQLLLAIRGFDGAPTIGDVAELLLLRHNSAVGLVDRAVEAGLVAREHDPDDHRVVRLRITPMGARRLRKLSHAHLEQLRRLAPSMRGLWADLQISS